MAIPVYQVTVPEYKLMILKKKSKNLDYTGTNWYDIKIVK